MTYGGGRGEGLRREGRGTTSMFEGGDARCSCFRWSLTYFGGVRYTRYFHN